MITFDSATLGGAMHGQLVKIIVLLALVPVGSSCQNASTEIPPERNLRTPQSISGNETDWQPAVFQTLTIGRSTRTDSIREFGEPISSSYSRADLPAKHEGSEVIDEYDYKGELSGQMTVASSRKNGIITSITILPRNVNIGQVVQLYGNGYRTTKYKLVPCPEDQGSSLIAESADGDLEFIEFRSKGIVVDKAAASDAIRSIEFVAGPIGVTSADCKNTPRREGSDR
jgi:hypothetical protein